jgi:hypothetical protein
VVCGWGCLCPVMAVSWKWKVEAKEFELVVRGGNTGVRFFERSNKINKSIFLQRAEVAWLDRIADKLVAVNTAEVFWDPSRAKYPRVMAQKCANRHGKFLLIEEFDGRRRSGSIMIPEGWRGQGWDRLKMEMSRANFSLGAAKEKRENKKMTGGRSYAEVVKNTQEGGSVENSMNGRNNKQPVRIPDGPKTELMEGKQTAVMGDEKAAVDGESNDVGAPVCSCSRAARLLVPKTLPNPENPGWEALKRRKESVEVGSTSMNPLGVRTELQELRNLLTKMKVDVEMGIKKVEETMGSLGIDGLYAGSVGCEKEAGSILRPKRTKRKRNKKKKGEINPTRPKPGNSQVGDEGGIKPIRPYLGTGSFQAGESSNAGAGREAGVLGPRPPAPAIMGKVGWVRRRPSPELEVASTEVGFSQTAPTVGPNQFVGLDFAARGSFEVGSSSQTAPTVGPNQFGGLDFAARGSFEVGSSSQTAPTMESGFSVQVGETGEVTEQAIIIFGTQEEHRWVSGRSELYTESIQSLKGGIAKEMATLSGTQVSGFASRCSGGLVLDNDVSRGHAAEELNPGALGVRTEGVGRCSLPVQNNLTGLEMVLYGVGEPIPLDWSQATEVVCGDGTQETNKEMELIMVFSQIVGVSCEGHIEKLRLAFAQILAGKVNKVAKKNGGGGGQGGRKGMRELVNLISTVNYEGGGGSVTRSRGKGRGNRIMI